MRWATVDSERRKARAISVVVRPPEKAQGEGDAGLRREDGVAGDEDEPEKIVGDGRVDGGVDVVGGELAGGLEFVAELLVFAVEELVAAEEIDGAVFCCGHEPCAGIGGDACLGPALERGDEGILGEVFGQADVANDAGESGDEPGGLDTPDGDRSIAGRRCRDAVR